MRHATQTSHRKPASQAPVRRTFTFECSCCEVKQVRADMAAPPGWTVLHADDASYIFCPSCGADQPQGEIQ